MEFRKVDRLGMGILLAASCGQSAAVLAQQVDELQEVVVTAERRAQNVMSVPISISVLSATDLEEKGVRRFDDLQATTPSFAVNDIGIGKFINIRGVGLQAALPQISDGIAYHVDGLFISPGIFYGNPYFDIDQVEILRGPQGTLVGQNSTGGAVFVNSVKPKLGEVSGYGQLEAGNYSRFNAQGAINVPLGDKWAFRLAGYYETRDSFFDNIGPATSEPGDVDDKTFRGALRYQPSEALDVILRGEVGRLSSGGYAQKPIRNSPVPNANFWPYAPEDPRTISINSPTFADVQIDRYSLEVNWDISDALRLRSQSGYQYGKMSNGVDGDGSPLTGSYGNQVIHGNTFTQELNLVSQGDGRAQWVLGALYLSLSNPNTLRVYNNFIPPSVPAPPALQSVNVNSKSAGWGYAVFGQVTYDLSESLQLIAGARYNKDERSDNGGGTVTITLPFPVPPTVIPLNGSATSDAVTGKLGLNWKPTDSDLIYLTASRGYKPGGFNNNAAPFDPEFVWNYELGWKAEVSSHLRAQVAAFYMDYSGMQVNVFDPQTQTARVQNASSAKITGAEAQATLRFGGFSLDASVGYVSSEVQGLSLVDTRFLPGGGNIPLGPPCTSPGTPPGCFNYAPFTVDLDGRQLAYAPDWTGSASMQYEFAIGNGTLTPRVQYSYMASQYSTLFQQPIADVVPSHNQTDFRLTYRNGEWMAEGYYTNAFDELYISGINGNLAFYGPPRQYGVRLSRTF